MQMMLIGIKEEGNIPMQMMLIGIKEEGNPSNTM